MRELHNSSKNVPITNAFTVPCLKTSMFPLLSPPCVSSDKIAPNIVESDSFNETMSPLRPHTRRYCFKNNQQSQILSQFHFYRKRRFKRMAVDPEPPPQLEVAESGDRPLSSVLMQQKTFSFSTFASSSIFAKPRQRKIKKKAITINKYPEMTIFFTRL